VRAKAFALMVCLSALPALARADDGAAVPASAATPADATSSSATPSTSPSSSGASSSEVVATAAGAPAAPTQASDPQLTRWLKQAPPVNGLGDDYQSGVIQTAPDRAMHGEVGLGFGTGGYRDAYAAVTMPVGKTGQLGVAVEDTQYGKPYKFEQRRLDVNLALGTGAGAAPADCASAIRVGDRYVEPLWATRIRGSALQDVDPRCVSADAPLR
jgi:hypothetical protein